MCKVLYKFCKSAQRWICSVCIFASVDLPTPGIRLTGNVATKLTTSSGAMTVCPFGFCQSLATFAKNLITAVSENSKHVEICFLKRFYKGTTTKNLYLLYIGISHYHLSKKFQYRYSLSLPTFTCLIDH